MARRTYGEDERSSVHRSVEDEKVIEAFIQELGAEVPAESVLNGEAEEQEVIARAKYDLVHPYEGENFAYALTRGEDVTARVQFSVEPEDAEPEVYEGHITYDAGEIFHPEAVVDLDEDPESSVDPDSEKGYADIEVEAEVESDSAAAMTD